MPNKFLCFFEEITKWVDEGSPVDVIYLDFQKAFDKVPHQRLILKLKSHGMEEHQSNIYRPRKSIRQHTQGGDMEILKGTKCAGEVH